jgi:hypothetical protein
VPTFTIDEVDYVYQSNPTHRNNANNKSQWVITLPEEHDCFSNAITSGWMVPERAWGLHFNGGAIAVLGVDRDHTTELKIARFETSGNPQVWHGYPIGRSQPPPASNVLNAWLQAGIISPAKLRKLIQRKPCDL